MFAESKKKFRVLDEIKMCTFRETIELKNKAIIRRWSTDAVCSRNSMLHINKPHHVPKEYDTSKVI